MSTNNLHYVAGSSDQGSEYKDTTSMNVMMPKPVEQAVNVNELTEEPIEEDEQDK